MKIKPKEHYRRNKNIYDIMIYDNYKYYDWNISLISS